MAVIAIKLLRTPYTYLLEWTAHNKRYIGARWAKGCHPNDLWSKYFTSSDYVREFVEKNGAPDVILIDQIFDDPQDALNRECFLQQKFDVIHNDQFLNKAIMGQYNYNDPDIRTRQILALRGVPKSPKHAAQCRIAHLGVIESDTTKERKRIAKAGIKRAPFSEIWKKNISKSCMGRPSPNRGKKQSVVKCPHCDKTGGAYTMQRWHFNNCRNKGV